MDFFEMIKASVLQILSNLRLTEACIGEVLEEMPLKITLGDKTIIDDEKIIRTQKFDGNITQGTRLLLLREAGGQKFFLIDTIRKLENE